MASRRGKRKPTPDKGKWKAIFHGTVVERFWAPVAVAVVAGMIGVVVFVVQVRLRPVVEVDTPTPTPTLSPAPSPTGNPLAVNDVILERNEAIQGGTWVFPRPIELTREDFDRVNRLHAQRPGAQARWYRAHGGVDPKSVYIKLVLEGNRREGVRVVNVRPRYSCREPLTGTLVLSPPAAGPEESVKIGFDLDLPRPYPQKVTGFDWGGDYFAEETVSLPYGEEVTFQIVAKTAKKYCTFRLQLDLVIGQKHVVQVVDNHGEPFAVSAIKVRDTPTGRGSYGAYERLYVGPLMNPKFTRMTKVDPDTFAPGWG